MAKMKIAAVAAVVFLIVCVAAPVGFYLYLDKMTTDTKLRRKRDADAFAVRTVVLTYMDQHGGARPPSLFNLGLEGENVDPTPFRVLPPGSRVGKLGQEVLVEAKQGGNGTHKIYICADGTVTWE